MTLSVSSKSMDWAAGAAFSTSWLEVESLSTSSASFAGMAAEEEEEEEGGEERDWWWEWAAGEGGRLLSNKLYFSEIFD